MSFYWNTNQMQLPDLPCTVEIVLQRCFQASRGDQLGSFVWPCEWLGFHRPSKHSINIIFRHHFTYMARKVLFMYPRADSLQHTNHHQSFLLPKTTVSSSGKSFSGSTMVLWKMPEPQQRLCLQLLNLFNLVPRHLVHPLGEDRLFPFLPYQTP